MSPREAKLAVAKKMSLTARKQQRVTLGEEVFVYEGGKLIEYEFMLPLAYTEFADAYEDFSKEMPK